MIIVNTPGFHTDDNLEAYEEWRWSKFIYPTNKYQKIHQ